MVDQLSEETARWRRQLAVEIAFSLHERPGVDVIDVTR
jgi:hypothetical protein